MIASLDPRALCYEVKRNEREVKNLNTGRWNKANPIETITVFVEIMGARVVLGTSTREVL